MVDDINYYPRVQFGWVSFNMFNQMDYNILMRFPLAIRLLYIYCDYCISIFFNTISNPDCAL